MKTIKIDNGVSIHIVGTFHFAKLAIDDVENTINTLKPDAVFFEYDNKRYLDEKNFPRLIHWIFRMVAKYTPMGSMYHESVQSEFYPPIYSYRDCKYYLIDDKYHEFAANNGSFLIETFYKLNSMKYIIYILGPISMVLFGLLSFIVYFIYFIYTLFRGPIDFTEIYNQLIKPYDRDDIFGGFDGNSHFRKRNLYMANHILSTITEKGYKTVVVGCGAAHVNHLSWLLRTWNKENTRPQTIECIEDNIDSITSDKTVFIDEFNKYIQYVDDSAAERMDTIFITLTDPFSQTR